MPQDFIQSAPMQFTDVSDSTQPAPSGGGSQQKSGGGLLGRIASGIGHAPNYFLKADIENPAKELAAKATGNKTAFNNALESAQQNLVGNNNKVSNNNATNAANFLKQLGGNTAQLGAMAIAPGEGGLASKAIMGVRAGALGGAGNALENNQNLLKGALTGGAAGGIIAPVAPAVLGAAGKVLGIGGKAATDEAGQAAQGGVSKVISNLANKQTAKETAMQAAQDSQPYAEAGVGKTDLQNARINDTAQGKGLFSTLRNVNMGTTPDQMQAYHDAWTGADGAGSGAMNQILSGAGDVKPGNLLQVAEKALQTENRNLGSASQQGTAANGLLEDITNTLKDTGLISEHTAAGKGAATVQSVLNQEQLKSTDTSATNAFKTLQNLETLSRNMGNSPAEQAQQRVIKSVTNSLGDALWNDSGVNKAVANFKLAPEDEAAIDSKVAQSGGSPELAQNIKDTINNAKTGPELRSAQEPAVRAGKLANAYDKASGGALTSAPKGGGMTAGNVLGAEAIAHAAVHPATGLPMLASLGGKKLIGSAGSLIGKGAQAIQGALPEASTTAAQGATNTAQSTLDQGTVDAFQKEGAQVADNGDGTVSIKLPDGRTMNGSASAFNNIKGAVSRQPQLSKVSQAVLAAPKNVAGALQTLSGRGGVVGSGVQGALQGAGNSANSLQGSALASNTASPTSGGQLSLGGQTLGGQQSQPTSQYPMQNMLEDIQRDPAKASTYEDLYKLMNPNYALTTNQQNEVSGSQKAQVTLQDYFNQLQSAGGGKGVIGGDIEDILGEFGVGGTAAAARAVNQQKTDVASAVAASLSPTGRPTASITKQIAASLPSITDSKSVAQDKMDQLMQRINDGEFTASQTLNSTIGQ